VGVNTAPLKEGLNDGKNATENFANSVDKNVRGKIGGAFDRLKGSVKSGIGAPIEAFQFLASRVFGAVAAVTALVAVIDKVQEALKSGTERAREFTASLNIEDPVGSIKQIDEALKLLDGRLERISSGPFNRFIQRIQGFSEAQVRDEQASLRQRRESASARIRTEEQRKYTEDVKKGIQEINELDASATEQALNFKAQKLREFEALRKRINNDGLKKEIDDAIEALNFITNIRLDRVRQAEQEQIKSAQRQADALARAFADAFKSIQQQQTGGFDQITASVQRIAEIVDRLERNRR
jgi:hypothetical protein